MQQIDVTVIIPVYNEPPERLIPTVESALATGADVLVLDDGSDVPVQEMTGVRLVRREPNRGHPCALNDAVRLAHTRWVSPLDSGDSMHPERFDGMIDLCARWNKQAMFCGWTDLLTGEVRQVPEKWKTRVYFDGVCAHSCLLYTRDAWKLAGGYDESLRHVGCDWEFLVRLHHFAGGLLYLDIPYVQAGVLPGGNTDRTPEAERQRVRKIVYDRAQDLLAGRPVERGDYT